MMTAKVVRKTHLKVGSLKGGPEKVKVGFPAGKADSDVVERAVFNEFGTRGGASGGGWGGPIPERPFMRNAMRNNQGKIKGMLDAGAKAILDQKASKRQVLSKLGIAGQGMIQEEITALTSPPNSPVTIKRKGSSKPLIDSGEMRAGTTWAVDE